VNPVAKKANTKVKNTKVDETKPYVSPTETWWGKAIIWILVIGMVFGIVIGLIDALVNL
jgi:hypothetical protein